MMRIGLVSMLLGGIVLGIGVMSMVSRPDYLQIEYPDSARGCTAERPARTIHEAMVAECEGPARFVDTYDACAMVETDTEVGDYLVCAS